MARWLILEGDIVVNVVGGDTAPDAGPGQEVILDPTDSVNVGDDMTAVLWYVRMRKQEDLDEYLDTNFDFTAFIRAGTVTTTTGTQVAAFIAANNNRYRVLRASIAAASTIAAINAIVVTTGWPANP
jgi:hypothetical protein